MFPLSRRQMLRAAGTGFGYLALADILARADAPKSDNPLSPRAGHHAARAKRVIFLSMEDETGIANVIVTPDLYDRDRLLVTRSKFLLVEGPLQNQDGVIHVKATRLLTLSDSALELTSHDFH